MGNILIFSGTTEGRELAEVLDRNSIDCHVCVATEYGSLVMPELPHVTIHEGRLDCKKMQKLYKKEKISVIVDATHPYANLVTSIIQKSVEDTDITYLRLLRPNTDADMTNPEGTAYYVSAEECANALLETEGNIFLTTGSKDLKMYCQDSSLRERLVVRVLPGLESLELCYENGLEGKQIIAMQGPFSKEMNLSLMQEYNIRHMVTKESGHTGGVESKISAAEECDVKTHIIRRPESNCEEALSMQEVCTRLEELLEVSLERRSLQITLAGIGCGTAESMTKEVRRAIEKADYVFGAPRMLETCVCNGQKYPYYLTEDILPELEEIQRDHCGEAHVVILFSGDSGFYSGASKIREALMEKFPDVSLQILPGISSIQMLSARIGIPWQDAKILSFHGVSEERWIPQLLDAIRYEKKMFFLTSGLDNFKKMAECLRTLEFAGQIHFYLGYALSYDEEKVYDFSTDQPIELAKQLESLEKDGLYVGAMVQDAPHRRPLAPELKDEDFLRDQVPITKEEVRKLVISQLELANDSIVYDIGAGTGSIAIQAAMMSPDITVYAVDCKESAVDLIQRNLSHFNIRNVHVRKACAPKGFMDFPAADCAFIGGNKGHLIDILYELQRINPKMRVVMTAVSMESIVEMQNALKLFSVTDVAVTQVSVSKVKELGSYHMLQANNPVFIFAFRFCKKNK
ncbi:MAG: precorrin-6A reductase [Lachnospiraceae bacterium]|nr:precorrin-6A reductase [Lachnospiraceae bacterium]